MFRRFLNLEGANRRLLCEAALVMVAASVGLLLLRFGRLRRALEWMAGALPPRRSDCEHVGVVARVRWAITAMAARLPASTCLVQALAADFMLRRRGLGCRINIGVRPLADRSSAITAHAWVESGGVVVVGRLDHLDDFTLLATLRPS